MINPAPDLHTGCPHSYPCAYPLADCSCPPPVDLKRWFTRTLAPALEGMDSIWLAAQAEAAVALRLEALGLRVKATGHAGNMAFDVTNPRTGGSATVVVRWGHRSRTYRVTLAYRDHPMEGAW